MERRFMTDRQRKLIDCMNEFCTAKLAYDNSTTCKEACDYISENIDEYKLLTCDDWALRYS